MGHAGLVSEVRLRGLDGERIGRIGRKGDYRQMGDMNWPIDHNWKCEVCEHSDLRWTLVFGEARCNRCGTLYSLFDRKTEQRRIIPQSMSKENWLPAVEEAWTQYPPSGAGGEEEHVSSSVEPALERIMERRRAGTHTA